MADETPEEVKKFLSEIGRKGGQSRSKRKLLALAKNRPPPKLKTEGTPEELEARRIKREYMRDYRKRLKPK